MSHNISKDKIVPAEHQFLVDFMKAIRKDHAHVSFISSGVDDRVQVLSNPPSDRIYVVPHFSEHYIDPQLSPEQWGKLKSVEDLLQKTVYMRLFIKGNPGIGKTTLLSRIAYLLADPGRRTYQQKHDYPVPMIATLRNSVFRTISSWDAFLHAIFQQTPHLKQLDPDWYLIEQLFLKGQMLIMLDGLDEITDQEQRKQLAAIISEGIQIYPKGYWWCTTRIVGFDQSSFWKGKSKPTRASSEQAIPSFAIDQPVYDSPSENTAKNEALPFSEVYLAPFNDQQLARYIKLWFDLFPPVGISQSEAQQQFLFSLKQTSGMQHLARIPNMLSMMALYHKVNQDFPDGRYELYDKIIEANLKIILRQRKMDFLHELSYEELRKCLAELAFEMQKKRLNELNDDTFFTISKLNAYKIFSLVLEQLARNESESDRQNRIQSFFNSLKVRSDILQERAEGEYGFIHLSIQEFLAAEKMLHRFIKVTSIRYRSNPKAENEYWEELKSFASEDFWQESLLLYFEGFRAISIFTPEDCLYASEKIFNWGKKRQLYSSGLLEKILMDEYIAPLYADDERWATLSYRAFPWIKLILHNSAHYSPLIEWAKDKEYFVILKDANQQVHQNSVWLSIHYSIETLASLTDLQQLRILDIQNPPNSRVTRRISLRPISRLKHLQFLCLTHLKVESIEPIAELSKLEYLELDNCKIDQLQGIANLQSLEYLNLANTTFKNLEPIAKLEKLKSLSLNNIQTNSIEAITELGNLSQLHLRNIQIDDIRPIAKLTNLKELHLINIKIDEITSLSQLKDLKYLSIKNTNISLESIQILDENLPGLKIEYT